MRYEGISKMGYYPTPMNMVEKIGNRLVSSGSARWFDPCCGEGEALAAVAPHDAVTFGIELDGRRAEEAKKRLAYVVCTGYERARVEPTSMQFLWLNPPYDAHSGLGGETFRKELIFLRDLSKYLAPNGVLVFIIPRYTLGSELVNALVYRYTDLAVYRFDEKEYQTFKQIVVFGRRRERNLRSAKEMSQTDRQAKNELLAYGKNADIPMPYLDEPDGRNWTVPIAENIENPILFRGYILDEAELRLDLAQSEAFKVAVNMLMPIDTGATLRRPLLPFRRTHMATLIAAAR
ncbi:DUF6094 domain-containing protein [Alicyclobacillus sacchari]|uniref:DUF6094 domain-containing protein n=1 Tax=Alicyclobacillus sacchari TaxID=392010 RepID=UPI0024E0EE20|nr:DUF6094 domain-containing protein [Alicyclobacillus sacchari]